tara:strand:+ start:40376 stop:40744 length:369 start_codon:yes stop_codon:yes gene_type:complete
MINQNQSNINSPKTKTIKKDNDLRDIDNRDIQKKGPLSFLSGAITSILFAFISLWISQNTVVYFSLHSKVYDSPIAQSIASGLKTLVIGMCFLATFTFGFIGLGLIIVFIRSLFDGKETETE